MRAIHLRARATALFSRSRTCNQRARLSHAMSGFSKAFSTHHFGTFVALTKVGERLITSIEGAIAWRTYSLSRPREKNLRRW